MGSDFPSERKAWSKKTEFRALLGVIEQALGKQAKVRVLVDQPGDVPMPLQILGRLRRGLGMIRGWRLRKVLRGLWHGGGVRMGWSKESSCLLSSVFCLRDARNLRIHPRYTRMSSSFWTCAAGTMRCRPHAMGRAIYLGYGFCTTTCSSIST